MAVRALPLMRATSDLLTAAHSVPQIEMWQTLSVQRLFIKWMNQCMHTFGQK